MENKKIKFTKMQAYGNDYVYINAIDQKLNNLSELAQYVSNRHFGIGSDGMVLICKSDKGDFRMRMFNPDGTEGEMCGNALRSMSKYVYEHKLTNKTDLIIETLGGMQKVKLFVENGQVVNIQANIGHPVLDTTKIPVNTELAEFIEQPVKILDKEFKITAVSWGNPHCVMFIDNVDDFDVEKYGKVIEHKTDLFPNKTNVTFAQVVDRSHIKIREWERGTGETIGCGTGCCTATVAAVLTGRTDRKVYVEQIGGTLETNWEEKTEVMYMKGPSHTVFESEIDVSHIINKTSECIDKNQDINEERNEKKDTNEEKNKNEDINEERNEKKDANEEKNKNEDINEGKDKNQDSSRENQENNSENSIKNRNTNLKELLENVEYELIKGNINIQISDIKYDSRQVKENDLFLARIGTTSDSHTFINTAIDNGAKAIIIERDVEIPQDVTVIKVKSSKQALAYMSSVYFKHPAEELITIGITGTAGKTSTTYMTKAMLEKAGKKVGLIGTICALIGDKKIELHNTTPESYEIQKMFREMVDQGCQYAIMEVSSQGLKMNRVDGFTFDYGVFTNISPEHIGPNEHENFEEYLYCKSLLFQKCKKGIINVDNDKWQDVIKNHTCEIVKYGVDNKQADVKASNIEFIMQDKFLGMGFEVDGKIKGKFKVSIPGRFSVYNSLCAMTIAHELGIGTEYIQKALENVKVLGRMELVSSNENYKLIVDYAHNEDEMNNLMDTISEYHPERLVCIFGGGGNRAKSRRYDMGEVAGKWSDLIILTQDNPRWEEMESINKDIIVGINKTKGKYIIIDDRKEAIKYAMENAQKGDIILLIGKGHENYQEIKGVRYHWDEREAVKEVENELKNL